MTIGITQRLLTQPHTGDVHNALSQDWQHFLAAVGLPWIPLPNGGAETLALAHTLKISGLIFSGGGEAGKEPTRDHTETLLWHWAQEGKLPVLGVCRGFQAVQLLMGGELVPLSGHVAVRHALHPVHPAPDTSPIWQGRKVNSYHNIGIRNLASALTPLALSHTANGEKHVEAARGDRFLGLMWHPEREKVPHMTDVTMVRRFLAGK